MKIFRLKFCAFVFLLSAFYIQIIFSLPGGTDVGAFQGALLLGDAFPQQVNSNAGVPVAQWQPDSSVLAAGAVGVGVLYIIYVYGRDFFLGNISTRAVNGENDQAQKGSQENVKLDQGGISEDQIEHDFKEIDCAVVQNDPKDLVKEVAQGEVICE